MRMPGTLVAIERNGPRTSAGAPGFGSQVSSWLGPPTSISKITARSRETASVSAARRSDIVRPSEPSPPTRRKSRRGEHHKGRTHTLPTRSTPKYPPASDPNRSTHTAPPARAGEAVGPGGRTRAGAGTDDRHRHASWSWFERLDVWAEPRLERLDLGIAAGCGRQPQRRGLFSESGPDQWAGRCGG